MDMMKKHIFWMVALSLPLLFSSCNKDGDETISLEYQKDNQGGGGSGLDDVLPSAYQKELTDHGMPIYSGSNPPNVEGCFYVAPAVVAWDSRSFYFSPAPAYVRLTNQQGNRVTYEMVEYADGEELYEIGKDALLTGSGNNFTLSFQGRQTQSAGTVTTATVVSGTIDRTGGGVRNAYSSFTVISKQGDAGGELMNVGDSRIIKDGDGWSPFVAWPR